MTGIFLGFSNNSYSGSFCIIIANITGGRPDDASLRDSLPHRSAGQPCRLPRHCQVIVTVIVRLLQLSLPLSLSCNCLCLVIVRLLPLFLSDIAVAIVAFVIVTSSAYKS